MKCKKLGFDMIPTTNFGKSLSKYGLASIVVLLSSPWKALSNSSRSKALYWLLGRI